MIIESLINFFNVYLANYLRQLFFFLTHHFNRRVLLG